jgi:hypothetical protein
MSCYRIEIYESGNVEAPLAVISSSTPLMAIATPDSPTSIAAPRADGAELVLNPETGACVYLRGNAQPT